MNTFLPYTDFQKSAAVLDRQRLGKQRVEVLQILHALHDKSYGWQNHPAVKMWRGYEFALATYGLNVCAEWLKRGYKDTCFDKILKFLINPLSEHTRLPSWLNDNFCRAHQSNLIRKDAAFYRPIFGDDIPDDLPYIWPVK